MIGFGIYRKAHPDADIVLGIVGLTVRVGIRQVFSDLSFQLHRREIRTLFGENGSGKTSLLNAIMGVPPAVITGGKIELSGCDITRAPAYLRARRGIGYLLQSENVFRDLSVKENLMLASGTRYQDCDEIARSILGYSGDIRAGLLSGGERQRIAIAMLQMQPHSLLLLDEPDTGIHGTLSLPDGLTAIISTHQPERWMGV